MLKEKIRKLRNPILAEEATGIEEQGKLEFWSRGAKISKKQARQNFIEGKVVAVPGAGAGSYIEVFKELGFSEVEEIDTGSSAGDWSFGVKNKMGWSLASQENRYPYYGFTYWLSRDFQGFGSFEGLVEMLRRLN